jgi:hypothetical protein
MSQSDRSCAFVLCVGATRGPSPAGLARGSPSAPARCWPRAHSCGRSARASWTQARPPSEASLWAACLIHDPTGPLYHPAASTVAELAELASEALTSASEAATGETARPPR